MVKIESNVEIERLETVNIVASGDLRIELDLSKISQDIMVESVSYNPEIFSGVRLSFEDLNANCNLFASGKYTIIGAKSHTELNKTRNRLISSLKDLSIQGICEPENSFSVKNIVCTYDLYTKFDLQNLCDELGRKNTEYEPEQSPFVVLKPVGKKFTMTIPTSGKIMVTGIDNIKDAENAIQFLIQKLNQSND